MSENKVTVLNEFIYQTQKDFPFASGDLTALLSEIGVAAKIVHREVNKAGLVNILGKAGSTNIQGEEVKKLDVYANEQFKNALAAGGECCGIASEEDDEVVPVFNKFSPGAKYVVAIDPLDGSSNIDVNVSIGTIFSIYRRTSEEGSCVVEDFMQKGDEQVAAGYVIYGSSTMLVFTTGNGVNGFTLDPSIGEFCLSHPNMQLPSLAPIYSVNQGYFKKFPEGVKRYIKYCQEVDKETRRPYSLRYIGSMVADIHRTLIYGGIFMYPPTADAPNGKLRLLYECNPMAFIVEQAGGKATNGMGTRILDIQPDELHQRVPFFVGSSEMIDTVEELNMVFSELETA